MKFTGVGFNIIGFWRNGNDNNIEADRRENLMY